MNEQSEYLPVLHHLYEKSLILHDTSLFNKVLYFFLIDSLAHIDYTISLLIYNYQSPKNIMGAEYLRWRIDEEKKGDRPKFSGFIRWLKKKYPEKYEVLPFLWRKVYDPDEPGAYRSFRIVIDPEGSKAQAPTAFYHMIEDLFEPDFLKSLYTENSLDQLFREYEDEIK